MYTTTNYGFNIVEGTDMVNPLTQLNPNFTALDSDLKSVSDNTVDGATCIKTGTVHAVTRTNTDANVFRFTATGNWNSGDTMTVDGTLVSVFLPDGSAPGNGCFVINTEVLASVQGTRVTLYVNASNAANIAFDDSSVLYTATNVQTAINAASTAAGTEYGSGVSVKDKIDTTLVSTTLSYSSLANGFVLVDSTLKRPLNQTCYIVRNQNTGDLYVLCWYQNFDNFGVQYILQGNAPADGNICSVQYIGI